MSFAKRTVTALTAVAACLMGIPAVMPELADTVVMTASAEDELTYGNLSYRVEDSGTITITSCDRSAAEVIIPAEIDGKVVTSIGDYAFYGCTNLTSVTIPEGVTKIGAFVFENCTSLTSITIPEGVTEIGDGAFSDCISLTSIEVDSGNENYVSEDGVLFNKDKTELIFCSSIKEGTYVIPESVKKIGYEAFSDCTNLTSVTIPEGVTRI